MGKFILHVLCQIVCTVLYTVMCVDLYFMTIAYINV